MSSNFRAYGEEAPYYAKFDKDKNYIKVLPKGGVALQARELTDMQTYTEYQMAQFAGSFFDDGQVTNGAKISYTTKQTILKIKISGTENYSYEELKQVLQRYVGNTYVANVTNNGETTASIYIKVNNYHIIPDIIYDSEGEFSKFAYSTDNYYFSYAYGGTQFDSNTLKTSLVFTCTTNKEVSFTAVASTDETPNPTKALMINNIEGTVFVDGFFTRVAAYSQVVGILNTYKNAYGKDQLFTTFLRNKNVSYSNLYEKYISYAEVKYTFGFDVNRNIISANEDPELNDPAIGTYNYKAPGANRQQLMLSLNSYVTYTDGAKNIISNVPESKTTTGAEQYFNFLPQIIIKNDVFYLDQESWEFKISKDTLAKRTYEESGNYTVSPWKVSLRSTTYEDFETLGKETEIPVGTGDGKVRKNDDGTWKEEDLLAYLERFYTVSINPGIGYIYGYRIQNNVSKNIIVEKPRTQIKKTNVNVVAPYGQYTFGEIKNDVVSAKGLIDFRNNPIVKVISDAGTSNGTAIGYEILPSSFTVDGTKYYYYIDYNQISTSGSTTERHEVLFKTAVATSNEVTGTAKEEILDNIRLRVSDIEYEANSYIIYLVNTNYLNAYFSKCYKIAQGTNYNENYIIIDGNYDGTGVPKIFGSIEPKLVETGFQMVSGTVVEDSTINYYYTNILTNCETKTVYSGTVANGIGISIEAASGYENDSLIDIIDASGTHISLNKLYCDTTTNCVRSISKGRTIASGTYTVLLKCRKQSYCASKVLKEKTDYDTFLIRSENDTSTVTGNYCGTVTFKVNTEITTSGTVPTSVSITSVSGDRLLLSTSDVTNITDIRGTGGPLDSNVNYVDTFSYSLNSGQNDYIYNKSSVEYLVESVLNSENPGVFAYIKENYKATTLKFELSLKYIYYEHNGSKEQPFIAASYIKDNITKDTIDYVTMQALYGTTDRYAIIPSYVSSNGVQHNLRDCIDFRKKFSEQTIYPNPGSTIEFSTNVYLPRVDRVWVDKNGNFGVSVGIEAENPKVPYEADDVMTIYLLNNKAYVPTISDIGLKYINNQRYTMKEIGALDKRISNLEDIVSLTVLEQSAVNMQITDEDGLTRYKSGIFTDDFSVYDNVNYLDEEWSASIDSNECSIRPKFVVKEFDLTEDSGNETGKIITLNPLGTEILTENTAVTHTVNVTGLEFASWNGDVKLTPSVLKWETDGGTAVYENYIETEKPTETYDSWTINSVNSVSASNYNTTESYWANQYLLINDTYTTFNTTTDITQYQISKSTTYTGSYDISDVYTKMETNDEFIRTDIEVDYELSGMAPNMEYCGEIDGVSLALHEYGATGLMESCIIGSDGKGTGWFYVPDDIPVGNKRVTFKSVDNSFVCEASTQLTGYGKTIVTNDNKTYLRTWTAETSIDVANMGNSSTTVSEKELIDHSWTYYDPDPIAETFTVSSSAYPNGVILESIEVYFAKSPLFDESKTTGTSSTDSGVFLYLTETENSYPSSTIVPFSKVLLAPSDVNQCVYDKNGNLTELVGTKFVFNEPIYLPSNKEYAFIIGSGCNDYKVYTSHLGAVDIVNGKVISVQPYMGSFFQSQNAKTWSANQEVDLTFKIHKYVYDTSNSKRVVFSCSSDTAYYVDTQNISINTLVPTDSSIHYMYTWGVQNVVSSTDTENKVYTDFVNSKNIDFDARKTLLKVSSTDVANDNTGYLYSILDLTTSDSNISPMVDREEAIAILSHNVLRYKTAATGEYIYYDTTKPSDSGTFVKLLGNSNYRYYCGAYISNTITLDNECNDVRVILDAIKPKNAGVEVYIRTQNSDNEYFLQNINTTATSYEYTYMGTTDDAANAIANATSDFQIYYLSSSSSADYAFTKEQNNNIPFSCKFYKYAERKKENTSGTEEKENQIFVHNCKYDIPNRSDINQSFPFLIEGDISSVVGGTSASFNVNIWDTEKYKAKVVSTGTLVTGGGTSYAVDDVKGTNKDKGDVFYFYNGELWELKYYYKSENNVTYPNDTDYDLTSGKKNWEQKLGVNLAGTTLYNEDETSWKRLSVVESSESINSTTSQTTNKQETSFVEYSYQLENELENNFSFFAVKIELYSQDEVHVPRVKNLRAIAVL